ncbi:uncharacterized protein LOC131619959 [Vicia villosa]|uniref:uncharacterized protein LOC131619959 n=1 Tax=Vicia villosa TaxID=3911 RepID=UPI00273BFA95|nr:uncharacterized protein LOC131619959 [Vicia villosa]
MDYPHICNKELTHMLGFLLKQMSKKNSIFQMLMMMKMQHIFDLEGYNLIAYSRHCMSIPLLVYLLIKVIIVTLHVDPASGVSIDKGAKVLKPSVRYIQSLNHLLLLFVLFVCGHC